MNKCVNECIRSWCISFLSPQLPEAARLVSSPARRPGPWARGRRSPSRQDSPGGSLTSPSMAPRQGFPGTDSCSSPTWASPPRGPAFTRSCAVSDPCALTPPPDSRSQWRWPGGASARATPPSRRRVLVLPARSGDGFWSPVRLVRLPTVARYRCWSRAVEKHRHTSQGEGVSPSLEVAEPTLGGI